MTIRVATTALANRIYAGHPCKDGLGFKAGRVDVTSDVLKAIGEFVGVGNEVTVECEGVPQYRVAVLPASAMSAQRAETLQEAQGRSPASAARSEAQGDAQNDPR